MKKSKKCSGSNEKKRIKKAIKKTRRNLKGKGQIFSSASQKREMYNNKFIDACIIGNIGKINELKDKVSNVSIGLFPAFACFNFHIMSYLIDMGADINYIIGSENEMKYIKTQQKNLSLKELKTGGTLLMVIVTYEAELKTINMFQFILALGADVNARSKGRYVQDFSNTNNNEEILIDSFTPLVVAIKSQNFYYVLPLIKRGANIYDRVSYYQNIGGELVIVNKNSLELISSLFRPENQEKGKPFLNKMIQTYREYEASGFKKVTQEINTNTNPISETESVSSVMGNPDLQKRIMEYLS